MPPEKSLTWDSRTLPIGNGDGSHSTPFCIALPTVTHNPKIVEIPTFCGFDHKGWGIVLTGDPRG